MVTVTRGKRRSPVLTPSGLACLSVLPTINLTAGCLHDCVYCYIRGYRNYPGESRIVLYEDTLERLRHELRPGQAKPRAVYFSPSSDLFQSAPEVLELSHAVLEFLFGRGIGVAFLTKGKIPDKDPGASHRPRRVQLPQPGPRAAGVRLGPHARRGVPIQNLPLERRREIFARLQEAAEAHGMRLDVCACKNSSSDRRTIKLRIEDHRTATALDAHAMRTLCVR
jgi:hypothetical protein